MHCTRVGIKLVLLCAALFLSLLGHAYGNVTWVDHELYQGAYARAAVLQLLAGLVVASVMWYSRKLSTASVLMAAVYMASMVYYLVCTLSFTI